MISKELIKPSSPTPPHLKNYKISMLEQLGPSYFIPLVPFYPSTHNPNLATSEFRHLLKKSLSETLTRFYPLAGRLFKDDNIVRCNDAGVEYSEARVEVTIKEFINIHDPDAPSVLVPRKLESSESSNDVQVAVRVNYFDCGGVAIAVSISHKIADAATTATFLECWASISRRHQCLQSNDIEIYPTFDEIANVLPPVLPTSAELAVKISGSIVQSPPTLLRRFMFEKSDIAKLKARGTNKDERIVPTRTQAVIALFWKCIISTIASEDTNKKSCKGQFGNASATSTTASGQQKQFRVVSSIIFQPVNLRSRVRPPLPYVSFGHIVKAAVASWPVRSCKDNNEDGNKLYQMLVKEQRDSIAQVDDAYARNRDFDPKVLKVPMHAPFTKVLMDPSVKRIISTSSCLSFPYYNIDFGWGNPVRVDTCKIRGESIVLFSSADSQGVEAQKIGELHISGKVGANYPFDNWLCLLTPLT